MLGLVTICSIHSPGGQDSGTRLLCSRRYDITPTIAVNEQRRQLNISADARNVIGWLFVSVPIVEYGGYFLLSLLRRRTTGEQPDLRFSYYRAGHAHAGVLVILAIIAQVMIDQAGFSSTVEGLV